MKPILSFRNVRTRFHLQRIVVKALDGVDLDVYENETLGIVGETGCGKSVLLLTALRLLPPNARVEGEILYDGRVNLLGVSEGEARKIIGREFALVPQGLGLSLNPVLNVGFQICERAVEHRTYSKSRGFEVSVSLLRKLGLRDAEKWSKGYPHQLSGGMKQRVLVAMGILGNPRVVFVDEPTKGLDVIKKSLLITLLKRARRESHSTFIIVSHDLGFVREITDRVCVMYCGQVVELSPTKDFFKEALHPYSEALLEALPEGGLKPLEGEMPSMVNPPAGCRFHPRCKYATEICRKVVPTVKSFEGRLVRCHRAGEFS